MLKSNNGLCNLQAKLNALIVTVTYNPEQSVLDNLKTNYYPHLIVDNSEIQAKWLKEYCNEYNIDYIWLNGNLGIAKALNIGAQYAVEKEFDYIVTMDQDSELTDQLLLDMTNYISQSQNREQVAVFSPRHVNSGIEIQPAEEEVTNDFYSMSSGNFVNLHIWGILGGFDEKLFIDMVDVDYYVRALISNYQVLTIQRIFMTHGMGTNLQNKKFFKYRFDVWNHNKMRKYYQARNFLYVYNKYYKHFPELSFFKKIILKIPISIILFESNKFLKLYYYVRGCIDFKRGKFGKIYF